MSGPLWTQSCFISFNYKKLFIQQVFIAYILCVRDYARCLDITVIKFLLKYAFKHRSHLINGKRINDQKSYSL